ncbi:MAG: 23S rRNA (pseudouridine(1915)-N(3))-methyltransferase RlmH [Clostridia bacterium]|nr:23S rRNA (pseudouridine(1915)-N(3))-methyltransferase RlmH [Clostridia bacterium]
MNINIIAVGKIKEQYYREACEEYQKRLSVYHTVKVVEVKDEKAPEKLSHKQEIQVVETEGEKLLKHLKNNQYVIALAIEGKPLNSTAFSMKIEEIALSGKSDISFVIGGSLGLSEKVLAKADLTLSFSDMTFPHQLMRVILLEQIYRAAKIKNNEPYHK